MVIPTANACDFRPKPAQHSKLVRYRSSSLSQASKVQNMSRDSRHNIIYKLLNCTYIHAYMQAYIHTYIHTYIHACKREFAHDLPVHLYVRPPRSLLHECHSGTSSWVGHEVGIVLPSKNGFGMDTLSSAHGAAFRSLN